MIIGRLLGWLLTIGGLAVTVNDFLDWLQTGTFRMEATGELWYRLDPPSLNVVQSFIQRYTFPELWDSGLIHIILAPAAVTLLVPGVLLAILCRSRKKRRHHLMR